MDQGGVTLDWTALLGLLWIPLVIGGFLVLNEGAKFVTDVATRLTRRLRRSPFVMGVLVVSALAALPEILVTIVSIFIGAPSLALGNAVGSIIVNLSFIVGLAALAAPLTVGREVFLRDYVFLATITLVTVAFLSDGALTRSEGVVLVLLFIPYALNLLAVQTSAPTEENRRRANDLNVELELLGRVTGRWVLIRANPWWLVVGVTLLALGAEIVTQGSVAVAHVFSLPQYVIGLTIVAVGTSIPDIAAAFHANKRGMSELALAVAFGANVFTLLLNIGLVAIFAPMTFSARALALAGAFALLQLTLLGWFIWSKRSIGRREGVILLAIYPAYVVAQIAIGV